MSKNQTGVYQKENGFWEYRFRLLVNGKQIARKKSTDQFGNKLKTKRQAIQAREQAIQAAREERIYKPTLTRRTVGEVYEEYCQKGRKDRAYQTIRKQDCLWDNHLHKRFGARFVDSLLQAHDFGCIAGLYLSEFFQESLCLQLFAFQFLSEGVVVYLHLKLIVLGGKGGILILHLFLFDGIQFGHLLVLLHLSECEERYSTNHDDQQNDNDNQFFALVHSLCDFRTKVQLLCIPAEICNGFFSLNRNKIVFLHK